MTRRPAIAPASEPEVIVRRGGQRQSVLDVLSGIGQDRRELRNVGDAVAEALRAESDLRALIAVTTAVAEAHQLDNVLEVAAEAIRAAVDASMLSIDRFDPLRDEMRVLINVGELAPSEQRHPVDERWALDAFPLEMERLLRGEPSFASPGDPDAEPAELVLLAKLGKRHSVSVPIVFEERLWGALWVTRVADPGFNEHDARLLRAMGTQIAAAVARAELLAQVTALAYEDPLTGLANRRRLDERLETALARSERTGADVAVLVCDIDAFKAINDRLGHDAGDRVLARVADALREAAAEVLPGSVVARLGGDEFCVVLDGYGAEAALRLAARAIGLIDQHDDPAVTLSVGIASTAIGARRPAALVRAADAAQYAAKRAGGASVRVAEPGAAPSSTLPGAAGRRALRDRGQLDVGPLVDALLRRLDTELAAASTLDRLEAVAVGIAEALDASSCAVSLVRDGDSALSAARAMPRRLDVAADLPGVRHTTYNEAYELADYPRTAAIMDGGAFAVLPDDPGADRAEVELLERLGFSAMLAAAAHGAGFGYLVEVYADEHSHAFDGALGALRLLVREAVAGR